MRIADRNLAKRCFDCRLRGTKACPVDYWRPKAKYYLRACKKYEERIR